VALAQPTALVAASEHADVCATPWCAPSRQPARLCQRGHRGREVGGAVKNVLAIATGLCDGLQLGLNARAALITRGLAEITAWAAWARAPKPSWACRAWATWC
jgi:glycerol-3-phosphate dehydrogenase (NAD(P)+)